jgi:uncharacterized membrane protein YdbT with pleckstrin-like domain
MGYIQKHLLPNERVIRRGYVSVCAYIPHIVMVLLGIATAVLIIGIPLLIVGIIAIVRLATVEVAVTDKRIIGKIGLISTSTLDLRLAKLEGISVRRRLFGAIFNYGSVTVAGSGNTRITFPGMHNPEALRRAFVNAAEEFENSAKQQVEDKPIAAPKTDSSPVFEVQVLDQYSGEESWIQVRAANKDDAVRRAADTGMVAGQCRLRSID